MACSRTAALVLVALAPIACKDGEKQSGPEATAAPSSELATLLEPVPQKAPGEAARPAAATAKAPAREGAEDTHPAHHHHLDLPLARCPLEGPQLRDGDALLDQAARSFDAGRYRAALGCAEVAADRMPQAVEVHHTRAAAMAALGRHDDAQVAFTMALALDPDDPETLAAAADFFINVLPPKRRETTMVGYEYARRGRSHAHSRRDRNRPLQARLALLEAQALNDLGRPDEALPRVGEALELAPRMSEARHERGVSLFNLCRFRHAREAFFDVLAESPDDPYAHHHLGLIYEHRGRQADADAHFERARDLAPEEFWAPVLISREAFRDELDRAVAQLPDELRTLLEGVELEIADVPSREDLTAVDPPFSPTILGLFRGLPHGVEAPAGADVPRRAIVLYRKNLARAVKARSELELQIRRTLIHEIGHLRGLDEDELRRRGLD